VYFDSNVYAQQGFSYSPAIVINPAVFASQLFLRPNYQHYYFGDYYGSNYTTAGFYPWFSYNSSRFGYDPIFAQQRWQNRQDPTWAQNVQADFQNRVDHQNARPPRTWTAQQALTASSAASGDKRFVIAAPLDQVTKSKDSPIRFQPIDSAERQKHGQNGQDIRKFVAERQKLETAVTATPAETAPRTIEPAKVNFPTSPIMATSTNPLEKNYVLPQAHQLPVPDLKVEPQPRVTRSTDPTQLHTVNKVPTTDMPPAVNQKALPPQLPPKNESKPVTGEPKGITQGQPKSGASRNPPGASTDKPPIAPKDSSKTEAKK
jgi:hypothetical protein